MNRKQRRAPKFRKNTVKMMDRSRYNKQTVLSGRGYPRSFTDIPPASVLEEDKCKGWKNDGPT